MVEFVSSTVETRKKALRRCRRGLFTFRRPTRDNAERSIAVVWVVRSSSSLIFRRRALVGFRHVLQWQSTKKENGLVRKVPGWLAGSA